MKKLGLLAGACALAIASTAVNAAPLIGSGPGTVTTTYPDAATTTFDYSYAGSGVYSGLTWTLSGIADSTGTQTFSYDSSGFYAYFNVRAELSAFSGADVQTLYNTGPANCCSSPSGGFDYTGTVTLDLVAGQSYGFTLYGSNGDSDARALGTLTVSALEAPSVPEPASWAMMVAGFGLLGGALRKRTRTNVSFG
ncbi:PEPxxWA-CTERM sorting domain-containing protein [Sphingomonas bacterium]|uniref:PEPxxWA-CTERM sorting domain-containing protein n=1 Tax=Sphingomonas bacterium TaxID=1895847 RepID=UPI001575A123|nr:PEPxxWA-CTERM sorting domain-containing protein [Sphingomonas bacterium]